MSGPSFDAGFAFAPLVPMRVPDPGRLYDVLVLGAGPAGIAAAIYVLRKGYAAGLLATTLGGQVAWTADIENYPGYRLVDGRTLVERFREQVAAFPLDIALDLEVQAVARIPEGFTVRAAGAAYRSRTLVAATGKRPRLLGVPGEQRLIGRGVALCAICDAPLYRGQVVGVVGGGNSGLEAALDLAKVASRVLLFQDLDRLTGDAFLERRVRAAPQLELHLRTAVTGILGEERVRGVRLRSLEDGSQREVALDGLFVEIGLEPNSAPFRGLAPLNARGEIEVDCACRTAVPGLFAAGDVTSVPYKQIVVAAGEGAKAALSACEHLLGLDAGRPGG